MSEFDDEDGEDFITGEDVDQALEELKHIFDTIAAAFESVVQALRSDSVSYDEAMKYFVAHKDDSPEIVKGAILKKVEVDGFEIVQVFLDKDNNLVTDSFGKPLGYKKKARHLDDELLHLFKGNDLIIVE